MVELVPGKPACSVTSRTGDFFGPRPRAFGPKRANPLRFVGENTRATGKTCQCPYWQVLTEKVGSNVTKRYVWSPVYVDAMVLRDRDTDANGTLDERLWVQQDANWNVTALVDGSGAVVERYVYDPYGVRAVYDISYNLQSGSGYGFTHGFQGMNYDSVVGLSHQRARWYSPTLGRWVTLDPIRYRAGDVNLYRALLNNPVLHTDPTGQIAPAIVVFGAVLFGGVFYVDGHDEGKVQQVVTVGAGAVYAPVITTGITMTATVPNHNMQHLAPHAAGAAIFLFGRWLICPPKTAPTTPAAPLLTIPSLQPGNIPTMMRQLRLIVQQHANQGYTQAQMQVLYARLTQQVRQFNPEFVATPEVLANGDVVFFGARLENAFLIKPDGQMYWSNPANPPVRIHQGVLTVDHTVMVQIKPPTGPQQP